MVWRRVGLDFRARSELALIPNMMYMDAGLDGRWKKEAHSWRDLERDVRLKEIK